jgi:hypothetical protein
MEQAETSSVYGGTVTAFAWGLKENCREFWSVWILVMYIRIWGVWFQLTLDDVKQCYRKLTSLTCMAPSYVSMANGRGMCRKAWLHICRLSWRRLWYRPSAVTVPNTWFSCHQVGTPISNYSEGRVVWGGVWVKHHLFLTLMPRARWRDWLNACAGKFSLGEHGTPFDLELIRIWR